jgi:small subunit ribosomal protein S19
MIIVPYTDPELYKFYFSKILKDPLPSSLQKSKVSLKYSKTHLYCRDTSILPFCVGKVWEVYNGKKFRRLQISEAIVGHKVGEFIPTRSFYQFKKKKKKWGKKTP